VFGSMVQNGKFAASIPACVNALNSVDLPTFGKPTMPHLKPISVPFYKSDLPSDLVKVSMLNLMPTLSALAKVTRL
jgi:hypothetical protein